MDRSSLAVIYEQLEATCKASDPRISCAIVDAAGYPSDDGTEAEASSRRVLVFLNVPEELRSKEGIVRDLSRNLAKFDCVARVLLLTAGEPFEPGVIGD
jgi:hypothetical protein